VKNYIAHVKMLENGNWAEPHDLVDHLLKTAARSRRFAQDLGADWAELAGRWHDLGKYRNKFQDYIRIQSGYEHENAHIENGKRAPHSTAGAVHAIRHLGPGHGHLLAYLIAGHHAGLPDWSGGQGSLQYRLENGSAEYDEAMQELIPEEILSGEKFLIPPAAQSVEVIALWMRFMFSCLVDADFLDTEHYMQPEQADQRQAVSLDLLSERFEKSMQKMKAQAITSPLNTIRDSIYSQCVEAAQQSPGLFSLTVPTGGGKTLSSMAFALAHAKRYNKRRIVYGIPYTSIIEQNANVFREFLGDEAIVEHHSNLDMEPSKENARARLAAENWNAPLIITTNVQLFESLHASRTSRCRKLHNLINSVIILDEAQQIPRDFHKPITQVMQQMSDHFGVSWVLCTATQPELGRSENNFGQTLLKGLKNVREIVSDPAKLAGDLRRVDVHMPVMGDPKWSLENLATKLQFEPCVLCIVNTRKQAHELYRLINDDGAALHLSTHMCAEHRFEILHQLKQRLAARHSGDVRPLRVVSTQLIEAGVDVDFPVVYRAMAGLDSIAQSAGRCNREGKLTDKDGNPIRGQVTVFKPEQSSPAGPLKQGEDVTLELIATGQLDEPLSPQSFKRYFALFNSKGERDRYGITDLLRMNKPTQDAPVAIQFREAAEKFRLIDNQGEAIIVPFIPTGKEESPVHKWLDILESDPSSKWVYKKLQRYTVTLPENQLKKFPHGALHERAGLKLLLDMYYSPEWGVDVGDRAFTSEECVI